MWVSDPSRELTSLQQIGTVWMKMEKDEFQTPRGN